jgi:ABC-type branched-subunit amino acid transport system ATPase component
MAIADNTVPQSLELPAQTARRVEALASAQHTTAERVFVDLIEAGLESRQYEELVERLASSTDPAGRKRLKEELAKLTFGE